MTFSGYLVVSLSQCKLEVVYNISIKSWAQNNLMVTEEHGYTIALESMQAAALNIIKNEHDGVLEEESRLVGMLVQTHLQLEVGIHVHHNEQLSEEGLVPA